VEWLSEQIPYYGVRHLVRPGITAGLRFQYKYGNTLEDAREKLQYDLFYIKNASLGFGSRHHVPDSEDRSFRPGSEVIQTMNGCFGQQWS